MSYNISHSEYIKGELWIDAQKARELYLQFEDDLPEGNFFDHLDIMVEGDGDTLIDRFWWYGEHSGHAYESCLFEILKHTKGHAQLLFVWEGGDSRTAVEVKDGLVTKRKIKTSLN